MQELLPPPGQTPEMSRRLDLSRTYLKIV
jgi:hypothetical protein